MNTVEEFCPEGKKDWRKWLDLNHEKKEAVWVIFHKKNAPKHNLTWSESVDEALCFGWIDSTKRTVDSTRYKQYFTKRKAKSNWSKVNKDKVRSLIDQGLMREAGYKSIEVAKENGSWTILDGVEALIIPEDLKEELAKSQKAEDYYKALSNSTKKMLLYWVVSAKREETRQKRIREIAASASREVLPEHLR
ncbi:MAG: YdeI/OmpD-associated family protein [Bacteroidetes bacterium]|nr:YdeI/OmpD-associated family protein [Bacteroidota bacterium]